MTAPERSMSAPEQVTLEAAEEARAIARFGMSPEAERLVALALTRRVDGEQKRICKRLATIFKDTYASALAVQLGISRSAA